MYDIEFAIVGNQIEEEKVREEFRNLQNKQDSENEQLETETEIPPQYDLAKMIVIDHEGIFITFWKLIDINICLVYSWMSMYLAVFQFEDLQGDHYVRDTSLLLEIFFLLTMGFEFLTDFKK